TPPIPPLHKGGIGGVGESDEGRALLSILSNRGGFLEESRVCLMLNISEEALKIHIKDSNRFKTMGGLIALSETVDRLRQKLTDALESCHRTHPSDEGVTEDGFLKRLIPSKAGRKGAERNLLFAKEVLRAMLNEGLVKKSGAWLSLQSHKAALPSVDEAMEIEILGSFSSTGGAFKAIDAEELYSLRPGNIEIEKAVAALLKAGKLVRIKGDVLASGTAVDEAREKLVSHIRKNGSIKAAEFRDLLGCGRKLAIELLEYFDGVKITLRSKDERTLR
ncbi:MAG: SelB C-terminal domain-containing protein, partial [Deltaproteobacteria bacterium]|nr:SelB C-terminal domain-containing protein [Deltaproteobacteria bacterium]